MNKKISHIWAPVFALAQLQLIFINTKCSRNLNIKGKNKMRNWLKEIGRRELVALW